MINELAIINSYPGQTVTLVLQVLDSSGARLDGYAQPQVTRIFNPSFAIAQGLPQNMAKLDTGLYYYKFPIPNSITSIGTYIADVKYWNSNLNNSLLACFQINILPFGQFSMSTF